MLEKLKQIEKRFEMLSQKMADPGIASSPEEYISLAKEYGELEPIVQTFRQCQKVQKLLEETRALLEEAEEEDLRQMAREELHSLEEQEQQLRKKLQTLLVPADPNDQKNAIVEIRAGTGGDEAAIFAGDLFRMYQRYCESKGWAVEILSASPSERGGFKEIIFAVQGKGAYGRLKYESGVHRVQRVPETETQGRIHTSAASVVVLPEVEDVDVQIDPSDLRIDVFRASGHGGQHVNTTDSAVRVVHIPTGIMATCQDEKSQHKNKAKALKVLKARLYDLEMRKRQQEIDSQRKSVIRTGDRSEKIRTYNFPQNRITDHRINLTLYRLNQVMAGELDELIDELMIADHAQQLQETQHSSLHE